jgi:restriction endonuclease S subunit
MDSPITKELIRIDKLVTIKETISEMVEIIEKQKVLLLHSLFCDFIIPVLVVKA